MTLQNHTIPRLSSAVAASLLALLTSACATFHGPAPLQTVGGAPLAATAAADATQQEESEGSRDPAAATGRGFLPNLGQVAEVHFDWPIDEARMTRGFLSQGNPAGKKKSKKIRSHWGLDLANQKGTPILGAERGTVIYTGHAFKGYGKLIVVEHNDEWATLYSHLDKILVKEGQTIARGEKIGEMGRTGRATGVHLHFEMRRFRQPVNPLGYLPQDAAHPIQASAREQWIRISQQGTQGSSRVPQAEPQETR